MRYRKNAWEVMTPTEFGERGAAPIQAAQRHRDPYRWLSSLEEDENDLTEFTRGPYSVAMKWKGSFDDWKAYLRSMRIYFVNYGYCQKTGDIVFNFKTAQDAVAAKLAFEE